MTGTILFASFVSAFTSRVPFPTDIIIELGWSTEMQHSDDSCVAMLSFILELLEDDKSTIKCHLFGLFYLGIIPIGLLCTHKGLELWGDLYILSSLFFSPNAGVLFLYDYGMTFG